MRRNKVHAAPASPDMRTSSACEVHAPKQLQHFPTYQLPSADPFKNDTLKFTPWIMLQSILMLPVALLRLLIGLLMLVLCWILGRIATIGLKRADLDKPFPRWRRAIRTCATPFIRAFVFTFGVSWVKHVGTPAKKSVAPIVVANHIGFIEPCIIMAKLTTTTVSRLENYFIPLAGTVMATLQSIFVDRADPNSRETVKRAIRDRASDDNFPHVLIFPEGTTTNQTALLEFKQGAFAPGLTVQPVAVQIKAAFNFGWVSCVTLPSLVWFGMIQPWVSVTMTWLPPYTPSEAEKKDPFLFAANVRQVIADSLQIPSQSGYSNDDVLIQMFAMKKKLPPYYAPLGFEKLREISNISRNSVKHILNLFADFDTDHSGYLDPTEFLTMVRSAPFDTAAVAEGGLMSRWTDDAIRELHKVMNVACNEQLKFHELVVGFAALNNKLTAACSDNLKTEKPLAGARSAAGVELVLVSLGLDAQETVSRGDIQILECAMRTTADVRSDSQTETDAVSYSKLLQAFPAPDFLPARACPPIFVLPE